MQVWSFVTSVTTDVTIRDVDPQSFPRIDSEGNDGIAKQKESAKVSPEKGKCFIQVLYLIENTMLSRNVVFDFAFAGCLRV